MFNIHYAFFSLILLFANQVTNLIGSQAASRQDELRQRRVITGLTASDSTSSAGGGIARSTSSVPLETTRTNLSAATSALLSQDSVGITQETVEKEAKEKRENVILEKKAQRSCCGNLFATCCLQATRRGLARSYDWCKEKLWESVCSKSPIVSQVQQDRQGDRRLLIEQIGLENQKSFVSRLGSGQSRPRDFESFYKKLRNFIYTPEGDEERARAFRILVSAEDRWSQIGNKPEWFDKSVTDRATWTDLNLFFGSLDKEDSSVSAILGQHVASNMGKAYLCGLLGRPTDNVTLLKSRQEILEVIQAESKQNYQWIEEVRTALKRFAEHEKFLTAFWCENYPDFPADRMDYFTMVPFKETLNHSSFALELGALESSFATTVRLFMLSSSALVLPAFGIWTLAAHYTGATLPQELSWVHSFAGIAAARSGNDELVLLTGCENPVVKSSLALVLGYSSASCIKQSWQQTKVLYLLHDLMRKILMHVAQVVHSMKEIHTSIKKLPERTRKQFTWFDKLDNFFTRDDKKIQQLFLLLDSSTFSLESDSIDRYAFRYGRVLCAWRLWNDLRDQFVLPLAAIGEIDTFVGLANLMQSRASNGVSFHFARYITDSPFPIIAADNFCNLFVDSEVAVTNSIRLGEGFNAPNMILTGPNSAGKSMTVFGLVQLAVIAQSLGITVGQASITPFSNIETYRNISDSQVDQESRFQVEARRIDGSMRKIDALGKNGFKFTVFDELFSGTNPKSASDLTCEYAKILGTKKNSISIISTHFLAVTELGKSGNGCRFVNYGIPVEIRYSSSRAREEAIRTYKLRDGVCAQDITRIVLAEIAEQENAKKRVKEIGTITGLPTEASQLIGQYSEGFTQEEEKFVGLINELLEKIQEFKTLDLAETDPIIQKRIEDLNSVAQKVGKVAPTIQELYDRAQKMKEARASLQFAEASSTALSLSSSSSSSSSATTMSAKTSYPG